ncbi:uncharacterized protein LOC18440719 isoform X2 [Amborella trichopoda]|uniref:uncharacterized protein LOC18440719 isoform X2 n=1 Tax=Amborella trichopoda TaxID=13333 RepID=UPI0005D3BDE8|nr:uncharacterized protein LOC18440719 isoform X2 [Amborella trichopoda]|eukprot:XP_011625753.1 uncharacterized protein LOC18440719 isoform X2 [Amborella trichopoda]
MDFFNVKRFTKRDPKLGLVNDLEHKTVEKESSYANGDLQKPVEKEATDVKDEATGEIEDDDDDFIMSEMKRRLKELRKNSFMVLIPEESYPEETSSSEWKDSEETEDGSCDGLEIPYEKYAEKMLFFDRLSAQLIQESDYVDSSSALRRTPSKKLSWSLRRNSWGKKELEEEAENLQQNQDKPLQSLEIVYISQLCLTWEVLHFQYKQICGKLESESEPEPESPICYSHVAQQHQQFQVLLQRFLENEPFEKGSRPEIYAHTKKSFPKLLHVPNLNDRREIDHEPDSSLIATNLIKLIETSILIFRNFLMLDEQKSTSVLNMITSHNHVTGFVQPIKAALDKKGMKLKELCNKKKGFKKKSWPSTSEDSELLLALIDIKVVARVLRTEGITKEQLNWCEEKIKKLDLSTAKLQRDSSPLLFPC